MGPNDNIKKADDDELPPPPGTITAAGDDEVPPAPVKKKDGSTSLITTQGSATPAAPSTGKYQWWTPASEKPLSNEQEKGTQQAPSSIFAPPVAQKLGNTKPTVYVAQKANDIAKAQGDLEEHKTNMQNFGFSDNFKKYVELSQQLQKADPKAPGYNALVDQLKQLEQQPFDIRPASWDEMNETQEALKKKRLPASMQNLQTVGDAARFYNMTMDSADKLNSDITQHVQDIKDVVQPLQDQMGVKLNKDGVHEMGVLPSLLTGFFGSMQNMATAASLIGASDDKKKEIYNNAIGQQIIDPAQPAGPLATGAQTVGGLLPYFIPGLGEEALGVKGLTSTVGNAFMNGAMMGLSGAYDNGVQAYKAALDKTNDQDMALASANKGFLTGGVTGAAVGGVGIPLAGAVGEHVALGALSKETVEAAMKDGRLKLSDLSAAEYAAYALPKNAIGNLPFPVARIIDNKFAQARGENVQTMDNVASSYFSAMLIGHVIDGLTYGKQTLSPQVKEIYENMIAKYGNDGFQLAMEKSVQNGERTQEATDALTQPVRDKAAAYATMPKDLTIEQENASLPLRQRLLHLVAAEKESVLPDQHTAEIEGLVRQINEVEGKPLSEDERATMEDLEARQKKKGDDGKLVNPLKPSEVELLKHLDTRENVADEIEKAKKKVNEPEKVDTGAPDNQKAEGAKQNEPAGTDQIDINKISVGAHSPDPEDAKGLVSGKTGKNITEAGKADAEKQGEELAKTGVTQIVSSPEQRAQDTAAIIAKKTTAKLDTNENLHTLDIGDFHGMKADEFKPIHDWFVAHPDATEYKPDDKNDPNYGKKMGESINDFAQKVKQGVEDVKKNYPNDKVHVVTHGYTRGVIDAIEKNGDWNDKAREDYGKNPRPDSVEITKKLINSQDEQAGNTTPSPKGETNTGDSTERTTSAKNAVTDKELEDLGLNAREIPEIKANQKTWDKVRADVDSGKVDPLDIADKINAEDNPVLTDEQTFALVYQKARILKAHDFASSKLEYAIRDKNDEEELRWLQYRAKLDSDFQNVADALAKGGTGVGRALQARQANAGIDDLSQLSVNHAMREAAGGNLIPEKVQARIDELVKKNKEAEKNLAGQKAKNEELQKGLQIQQEINAQKREAEVKAKGKYTVAGKEIADNIRKLKGKGLVLRDEHGNEINVTKNSITDDIIELGAKAAEAAGKTIDAAARIAIAVKTVVENIKDQDWYRGLTEKGKRAVEQQLADHFNSSQEPEKASATEKIDAKIKEGAALKDLKSVMKQRQRELVEDALSEGKDITHEDVTRTITGELEQQYKDAGKPVDFTERDVRDVMSGYGETRKASQAELDKEVRDQTTKMRLASSKEDIIVKGQAPLKSGYQPDKPTDEIRGLQREVKRIMKEKGIEDKRSPEQRWKTALDAVKSRLRNQIADLTEQISTGKAPEPNKPVEYDAEAKALKAHVEDLKKTLDAVTGRKDLTDEQRVKGALRAVEKSLKEYQRRFVNKDFSAQKPESKTPSTPELERLRAMRDNAKEEYEKQKKAANNTPENVLKAKEKHIAELEQKIKDGEIAERKKNAVTSPEIDKANDRLKKLHEQIEQMRNDADPYREERKALDEWRKRTGSNIEKTKQAIEDLKSGKEQAPPKQAFKPMSEEDLKLEAEAQKYKRELAQIKRQLELQNQTKLEKSLKWIQKIHKFSILLSYKVLGKLMGAGIEQAGIFTPARKIVQTGLGKLPFINRIARNAPTEGNYSAASLAANYTQLWSKAAWADAANTLKTGKSEVDQIHSKEDADEKSWTDFVQNSHAAIKTIPKRAEYFSSVQSATEWAIKNGFDVSQMQTQKMIHDMAYDNAVRNIFMNKNMATQAYKVAVNFLKNQGGVGGKIAAAVLGVEMPIIAVPTNIVNDASSYIMGAVKAAWTVGVHGKGVPENLTAEQSDHVMRSLGKQAIGAIAMTMAYQLYGAMGGFYHNTKKSKLSAPGTPPSQDDKKKPEDLEPGSIDTPYGTVPAMFLHHPGFMASMFAADIERQIAVHEHDKHRKGKEPFSLGDAMVNAVGSVLKQVPFVEQPAQVEATLKDSHSLSRTAAQLVSSYIPQAVKDIAKATDKNGQGEPVKRKPKDFTQQIESNVPGLRENVPTK